MPRRGVETQKTTKKVKKTSADEEFKVPKERKPYRARPGRKSLREIARLQKGTDTVVGKQPFRRLFKEVLASVGNEVGDGGYRLSKKAKEVLQVACEDMATHLFADAQICANMGKSITVKREHLKMAHLMQSTTPQERFARTAAENRILADERAARRRQAAAVELETGPEPSVSLSKPVKAAA